MIVNVRPVTMGDAPFLLSLKNDATSRKFSIVSHEKITFENHLRWLEKTIKNKRVIYYLIETDKQKPCGTVRFDLGRGKSEIAIHISKNFRGKGIASSIIARVGGMIRANRGGKLAARIVDGNMRSMMVFLKNGFELQEHKNGVSYLEK